MTFSEKLRSINFAGKARSKTRVDDHGTHTVEVTTSDERQDVHVNLRKAVDARS